MSAAVRETGVSKYDRSIGGYRGGAKAASLSIRSSDPATAAPRPARNVRRELMASSGDKTRHHREQGGGEQKPAQPRRSTTAIMASQDFRRAFLWSCWFVLQRVESPKPCGYTGSD